MVFCDTEMSDAFPEFWRLGSHRYSMCRSKIHSLFESCVMESSLILDAGCGDKGGYVLARVRAMFGYPPFGRP